MHWDRVTRMKKIRTFFSNHHRKVIQVLSALIYNANLPGFFKKTIYMGPTKKVCVPGLNCYSCPGAMGACPLGSLQAAFGNFPTALPLYVVGFLLLFGALLGRAVCAFLCPFGLIQELLYKIPTPKLKKSVWTRRLSLLKYGVLAVMVIGLPLYFLMKNGVVTPAFCKWLCPAGNARGRNSPGFHPRGSAIADRGTVLLESVGAGSGHNFFGIYLSAVLPVFVPVGGHLFVFQPLRAVRRAGG